MRVNVLHPIYLTDQHLVAEYREVKMGPKALSRSLGSLKGVDKKRISPLYTLNTGHTYFFYDKNAFLERRLGQIVEEMKNRGFQTNHIELIDDSYDYNMRVWDDEWWNDWQPTEEALAINMERIVYRLSTKEGWYKFWGRPVCTMDDLISTRVKNSFIECPNCKAIVEDSICWNCCKVIPTDIKENSYF